MLPKIDLVAAVLGVASLRTDSFRALRAATLAGPPERDPMGQVLHLFADMGTLFARDMEPGPADRKAASHA